MVLKVFHKDTSDYKRNSGRFGSGPCCYVSSGCSVLRGKPDGSADYGLCKVCTGGNDRDCFSEGIDDEYVYSDGSMDLSCGGTCQSSDER